MPTIVAQSSTSSNIIPVMLARGEAGCNCNAVIRVRAAVFYWQYGLGLLRSPAGINPLATRVSVELSVFQK
jgi:hypothetical protein